MEPDRAAEIDAAAGALRAAYDRFRAGLGGAETPNPLWRTTP
jgi:hypothetical protein